MVEVIIHAAVIHGIILLVAFRVRKNSFQSRANRILAGFLLLIIFFLLGWVYHDAIKARYPKVPYLLDMIVFIFGPACYWFLSEVFQQRVKKPAKLFVPLLIFLISLLPYYAYTGAYPNMTSENPQLVQQGNELLGEAPTLSLYAVKKGTDYINLHGILVRLAGLLVNAFFLWKSFRLIQTFRNSLNQELRRDRSFLFLKTMLVMAGITFVAWCLDLLPYWSTETWLILSPNRHIWLSLSLIVYLLSFYATLRPDFFRLEYKTQELKKMSEQTGEFKALGQYIMQELREKRLYINSGLTLEDLSSALSLDKAKVSQVIKHGLKSTFYDLLATERLKEFLLEAGKEENRHLTYEAIAMSCGFRSKSNFYKYFKKSYAMNPREYLHGKKAL